MDPIMVYQDAGPARITKLDVKTCVLLVLYLTSSQASADTMVPAEVEDKTLILSLNVPVNTSEHEVKVNTNVTGVTDSPTNQKSVRLFSRVGLFLHVNGQGTITGVLDRYSPGVFFTVESFGSSVLRIKSKSHKKYIAMSKTGELYVTTGTTDDTLFYQNQEENLFISFASVAYYRKDLYDMFIGVKRNGATKLAVTTAPGQESVQFLIIDQ